jgi:hypothetical protein
MVSPHILHHHTLGLNIYCASPKLVYIEPSMSEETEQQVWTAVQARKAATGLGAQLPNGLRHGIA